MNNLERLIKLENNLILSETDFRILLDTFTKEDLSYAMNRARKVREKVFGNEVYIRGLIELTSYCVCDCLYCGIRRENKNAERYRLSKEEVLSCCRTGYELGFRTFVIQGGEDPYYSDEIMTEIVSSIRKAIPIVPLRFL